MNVKLAPEQIKCIQWMNQENFRYLVNHEKSTNGQLEVHFKFPENAGEEKLIKKLFALDLFAQDKYNGGRNKFFKFIRSKPQGSQFLEAYFNRYVLNMEGTEVYFMKSEPLVPYLSAKKEVHVNLEHKDHYEALATLNRYNVQYLIVDQYPIEEAFGGKYDTPNYLVVWFKMELENAKLVRKVNKLLTGNPPSIPSITKGPRLFLQGQTYWRNYYKKLDFETVYSRRCLLNIEGLVAPFLHPDDLI